MEVLRPGKRSKTYSVGCTRTPSPHPPDGRAILNNGVTLVSPYRRAGAKGDMKKGLENIRSYRPSLHHRSNSPHHRPIEIQKVWVCFPTALHIPLCALKSSNEKKAEPNKSKWNFIRNRSSPSDKTTCFAWRHFAR